MEHQTEAFNVLNPPVVDQPTFTPPTADPFAQPTPPQFPYFPAPTPPAPPAAKKSKAGRIVLIALAVLVGLGVIGAMADKGNDSSPSSGTGVTGVDSGYSSGSSSSSHAAAWTSSDITMLSTALAGVDGVTTDRLACMGVYVMNHYYPYEVRDGGSKVSEAATLSFVACN